MKRIIILLLSTIGLINVLSQEILVDANNEFAFNIYRAAKPKTDNFFFSPFSLNIALSIANEGANTSTRKELSKLLNLSGYENIKDSYDSLVSRITSYGRNDINTECSKDSLVNKMTSYGEDELNFEEIRLRRESSNLYLANSIWIEEELDIKNSYIDIIENSYGSEIIKFSIKSLPEANKAMNKWVMDKTHGCINELSELTPDIKLSILNAIYFNGFWSVPFKKEKTKPAIFHNILKEESTKDFMNDTRKYRYFEDSLFKSIYLNYTDAKFYMMVILPKKTYGINMVEKKLNPEYLQTIRKTSKYKEVKLSMPKFKIETDILPKQTLSEMGYSEMFSKRADFSKISEKDSLKIDEIIHKTFIEINEVKTEAYGYTRIDFVPFGENSRKSTPKVFNADHPFIFFIMDREVHTILFMGNLMQ